LTALGSLWPFRVAAWTTLVVLVVTRRFQHLFVVLAVILLVRLLDGVVTVWLGRMRPADVTVLGDWDGYAHPSTPVVNLVLGATIVLFALVPGGRWRVRAAWAVALVVGLLAAAR